MPVVFEQPGPLNPAASYAGGWAQAYLQDHASFDRMAATTAQIGEAGLRSQGQGIQNLLGVGNEALQFQQQQIMQGRQFAQQQIMEQMHAAQQGQELSQAENLRMNRLQNGMNWIAQEMDSGNLSPQEGHDLMTQVQTGYSPLKQRMEQQQQQQRQQQMEMQQEQAKALAMHNKTYRDFMNMGADQLMTPIYQKDEQGNTVRDQWNNPVQIGAMVQHRPGEFQFQHVAPPAPPREIRDDQDTLVGHVDAKGVPHYIGSKGGQDKAAALEQKRQADELNRREKEKKTMADEYDAAFKNLTTEHTDNQGKKVHTRPSHDDVIDYLQKKHKALGTGRWQGPPIGAGAGMGPPRPTAASPEVQKAAAQAAEGFDFPTPPPPKPAGLAPDVPDDARARGMIVG